MSQHSRPKSSLDAGPRRQLGEMLIAKGYITPSQLTEALEHQVQKGHKKLIGEILV